MRASTDITRRQEAAIVALLATPTLRSAASKAGVSEATLHRWLATPAFAGAYRSARREAVGHATGLLQAASVDAVRTLRAVMRDASAPAASRVAAARAVIELAQRGVDLDDLAARVDAIEAGSKAGATP